MRVPLSWLQDYVKLPAGVSVEVLAERLTTAGLEVAHIEYLGVPQGEPTPGVVMPKSNHLVWDQNKIVLGYIHEVLPHPDADRLILAMVDHGTGEIEQIVTGAPNLLQYRAGTKFSPPIPVPIAREGAEVYDGHAEEPGKRMVLKEKKIRGIPNRHMVCSEMELGISQEHEGVLLLDYHEYQQYQPGTALQEVLGDVVLNVEFTPNMARAMSILGVAREVAALFDVPLQEPDFSIPQAGGGDSIENYVQIDIREPELNPRFTLGMIKNVQIKPSPEWLQRRLKLIGQRPINNVVDVTNYVMFEIGQPTHAFDYDILARRSKGSKATIITELAKAGEKLTTLDGKEHTLSAHNLLVADTAGSLSFGGIMGGLESEVQDATEDQPGSQNILLEAAAWNYINIRKTLSSTKIHTEAAARFSRGVHPAMALRGLARGLQLLLEVSGGTLVSGIIDEYPMPAEEVVVDLPVSEVTRLLGFHIPQAEVSAILQRLGFTVAENGDVLSVIAPDHRVDIGTGVIGQADLIEEVARVYGYNNIPDTLIADSLPPQRANVKLQREETVRDLLVQAGLREVINYRLTTPEHEALLVPRGLKSSWGGNGYVTLLNPISQDKVVMRHTLLAGLLDNVVTNARYQQRQMIFEVGNIYMPNHQELLPDEITHLGIALTGLRQLPTWDQRAAGTIDFYDLKGVIEALVQGLHVDPKLIGYTRAEHTSFHPGRSAQLVINGEVIGIFGEVHPLVLEAFDLDIHQTVVAAELDLDALAAYARAGYAIKALPTQPAVYQDISLVVDNQVRAADIEKTIWQAGGQLLVGVTLFDVYTGDPIPQGKKSLAYSLTYQHAQETLTDKQVASVHQKIVKSVEKQLGAQLRA